MAYYIFAKMNTVIDPPKKDDIIDKASHEKAVLKMDSGLKEQGQTTLFVCLFA